MTWRSLLAGALAIAALNSAAPARADGPAVVELFTSQGCSSCPPADAMLRELAARPGVLALGYHVDYWDRFGWKDPFSFPAATERQHDYARRFGRAQVYTPQLVLNGTEEFVGSDRRAIEAALHNEHATGNLTVSFAPDRRSASVGPGAGQGTVLLLRFVQHRTTRIEAGENARRTADDTNAVQSLTRLGGWQGGATRFDIVPPGPGEGVAVLVQNSEGRLLGAGALFGSAGS